MATPRIWWMLCAINLHLHSRPERVLNPWALGSTIVELVQDLSQRWNYCRVRVSLAMVSSSRSDFYSFWESDRISSCKVRIPKNVSEDWSIEEMSSCVACCCLEIKPISRAWPCTDTTSDLPISKSYHYLYHWCWSHSNHCSWLVLVVPVPSHWRPRQTEERRFKCDYRTVKPFVLENHRNLKLFPALREA